LAFYLPVLPVLLNLTWLAMIRELLMVGLLAHGVVAWAQTTAAASPPVSSGTQTLQGLFAEQRAVGANFAYAHYYFWPDGQYCLGLPVGGVDREPADFVALQRSQPCGQYRIAEGRLMLQPREGAALPTKALTKREGDRFLLDGNDTFKVPSLPSNQAIEGQYSALVVGSQMTRQTYLFRMDGTYQFTSTPMTSADGSPESYSGSYKFVGNTLQLTGAPPPSRLTAYPVKQGAMMIEGTVFAR
jgi:hypothetical protein